jgi:hypothetical protein
MYKEVNDLVDKLKRALIRRRTATNGFLPVAILVNNKEPYIMLYTTRRGAFVQSLEEFTSGKFSAHYIKKWRAPTETELLSWILAYSL